MDEYSSILKKERGKEAGRARGREGGEEEGEEEGREEASREGGGKGERKNGRREREAVGRGWVGGGGRDRRKGGKKRAMRATRGRKHRLDFRRFSWNGGESANLPKSNNQLKRFVREESMLFKSMISDYE